MNFKSETKPLNPEKKQKKKDILKTLYGHFDGRERLFDAFEYRLFPIKIKGTGFSDLAMRDKVSDHYNLKILALKKMLQRLSIALAQVKSGNTSENLLNEIRQII